MGRGDAALIALTLLSFGCNRSLPELPQLAIDKFLPAIREEVRKDYEAARANPRDPAANGRLAMRLHAHDQLQSAETCYARAHLLEPGAFRWLYYLATVQLAQGKNQEAAETYRKALRLNPDYLPAQVKLAEALLAAGRAREAEEVFEGAAKSPGAARAWYGLGRARAARSDLASATEAYQKACELFPSYGAAHYALALAYRRLGKGADSEQHFREYEKNPNAAPPLEDPLEAAVRELNAGAVRHVRHGIQLDSEGKTEEAIAAHELALQIDPKLEQAHLNLVSLYGRIGRYDKAEEHYRVLMQLNPNLADAHYNYGVMMFRRGKLAEAEAAFKRALEINPFDAEAQNNFGYLLERQGRLDEAFAHFSKAVENRPDYRLAHFHLGRILVHRKEYAAAIWHFEKTLAPEDESTPGYLYALAATYARAGDRSRALSYGRKARDSAAARGQRQLLAAIERDLGRLEQR